MLPEVRKSISSLVIPERFEEEAFDTQNLAVNHYALSIAAKLCSIDGDLNLQERRAFLSLFPYFDQSHLGLLTECVDEDISVYNSARRFCKFTNDSMADSARLFAKLFKLAISDDVLNPAEVSYLEKIMPMIGLKKSILHKGLEYYFTAEVKLPKNILNNKDAKMYLRNQITKFHPDVFYSADYLSKSTKNKLCDLANEKMKMLNENYSKAIH